MADHSLHTPESRIAAFANFRSQPSYRFMTKLRQRRAEQIRALFANPKAMTLDRFNREIWQIGGRVLLRGQPIADKIFEGIPSPERLAELSDALDAGELEVEGNSMWRPGSSVYGSSLKENDAAKVAHIHHACAILTNRGSAPFERAKQIAKLPGFGPGAAGMLVMIAHPDGWALDNDQSRGGLRRLGFAVNTSTDVQVTVSQLRETLGASDLIELDLFLYMLNQRPQPDVATEIITRAPTVPTVSPFAAVQEALHQKHLSFPPELVSIYLLALQAKGFVILTGISGTGKTQLALEVARHFQPVQRLTITAKPPDGARALIVKSYTVQESQMIVPIDVIEELGLSREADGNRTVTVYYPGGSFALNLYTYPGRDIFMLRLRNQLKTWFQSNLHVGDTFFLEVLPATDSDAAALRFSMPMTMEQERRLENVKVLAVRPDWTDAHGLLGYFNPLTRHYESTPFLRFLLEAERETTQAGAEGREPNPYFIVLDEMNLARVEYYFADFLSCLESGEALELHDDREIESGVGTEAEQTVVPRRLTVPRNLFFTGTVNVDETTSMFSPKVLDRAFTIEFNQVDLRGLGTPGTDVPIPLALTGLPERLLQPGKITGTEWVVFGEREGGKFADVVIVLNDLLARDQRQFGYRVANEIARFVNLASDQSAGTPESLWAALDSAILAKALPKLAGTQQELEDLLIHLFTFALSGSAGGTMIDADAILTQWRDQGGQIVAEPTTAPSRTARLPRTAAKLWRMFRRLRQQGFTAFVC